MKQKQFEKHEKKVQHQQNIVDELTEKIEEFNAAEQTEAKELQRNKVWLATKLRMLDT